MAKRKWTEEERKAFGEKMKKARESKETMLQNVDKGAPIQPAPPVVPLGDEEPQPKVEPSKPKVELDLTDRALDSEAQLHQYILWEFDEGRIPDVIKVTSHQASNISNFTRQKPLRFYQSTFGNHYFKIVSAKEMQNVEETL